MVDKKLYWTMKRKEKGCLRMTKVRKQGMIEVMLANSVTEEMTVSKLTKNVIAICKQCAVNTKQWIQ